MLDCVVAWCKNSNWSAGVVDCVKDTGRDALSGRSASSTHHWLPSSSSETDMNVATSSPVASVSIYCMI